MMRRTFKIFLFVLIALTTCQMAYAKSLCDSIADIKRLPHQDEMVDDKVYVSLMKTGEKIIPCLIKKITDTTKMRDPYKPQIYDDVRVGDVAYFVFLNIAKMGPWEMLPVKIQERYENEGIHAYFKFVEKSENRKWLQNRLNEWYRKNYK